MLAADGVCDLIVPYCTCSEHLPGDKTSPNMSVFPDNTIRGNQLKEVIANI